MSEAPASRRELIRRGAIAAGTVGAAGLLRPALAGAQSATDEDLRDFLADAIGLEQITVLAYASAADAADSGGDRQQLEDFRDQEQAHANALRSAIDEIGFDPPEAPDSPTDTGVFDDVDGLDTETARTLIAGIELYGSSDANVFMNDEVFPLDTPQIQQSIDSIGSVMALVHPDIPLDQAKVDGSYVSSVSR